MDSGTSTILTWVELNEYLREMRETVLADLPRATSERELWQAQGKMQLISELLNLQQVFQTMEAVRQEARDQQSVPVLRGYQGYRVRTPITAKEGSSGA